MAPSRSWTSAGWIAALSSRPSVSTRMCRFLPLTFLPASYPDGSMCAPLFRALDTLAVDDGCRRARLLAGPLADLDGQGVVQPPQRAVPGPQGQVVVHRAPRRQVLGQGAPLAPGGQDVEDAVQDLAHVHRALAAAALRRRDEGLDQCPFLVRQVARVAQSRTVVDLPLLHGPHRASPPCPTSTAKPLPRFVNLPDRFLEPPTSERVRSRASAPGAASAGQNPLPGSSTWPTAAWS